MFKRLVYGLVAGLLAVFTVLAGAPAARTPDTAARASLARVASAHPRPEVRVGTYNVRVTVPAARARATLVAFLEHVDLAGIQEWGGARRNAILRDLPGWGFYRPPHGGSPVLYRTDLFELLPSSHGVLLAHGRYVGHAHGRRAHLPDYRATVAHLRYKATGELVVLINWHGVAHVEKGGRPWPGQARRVRMASDLFHRLLRSADHHATYATVFLTGDSNVDFPADRRHHYRGFPVAQLHARGGFDSAWLHFHPSGTLGRRAVDGVWSRLTPETAEVLRDFHVSDHKPVVAVYLLTVPL